MSATIPTQSMHIEALILAFSHSAAKTLVGTDALRTVISGQYRDMMTSEGFDLEPLWSLLESQPGFDADTVKPPLCRFKTWEKDLEIAILLPERLRAMDPGSVHAFADRCRVPSADLDKILERGKFTPEARTERAAKWSVSPDEPQVATAPTQTNANPLLLIGVTFIALISLGVAGFFLFSQFKSTSWDDVSPVTADEIPNSKAERLGMDVNMTLVNDGWLSNPEDERRRNLLDLITKLGRDGVENIVVRDSTGKIRATAQRVAGTVKIRLL